MYLHPNTRFLTTYGTPAFCDSKTPPAFRTLDNKWIAAIPQIIKLKDPIQAPSSPYNFSHYFHEDLSGDAGLYTLSQAQASIQALQDVGLHRQLQQKIINYVCHNTGEPRCISDQQSLSLSAFTPEGLIHNAFEGLLSKFLHIMNEIGVYASLGVAFYLTLGLLRSITTYLCNLWTLFQVHGLDPQILRWSIPEVMTRKTYKYVNKHMEEVNNNSSLYVPFDPAPCLSRTPSFNPRPPGIFSPRSSLGEHPPAKGSIPWKI